MTKCLLLIFCLVFMTPSLIFAQSSFKVTKPGKAKLPGGIKFAGELKEAVRWNDKLGDNIAITSETGKYQNTAWKHDNSGSDAELFAYHYIVGDTARQTWKIYDFIKDCDLDMEANFVKGSLRVTDLNKDGVAEVWLMYKVNCAGDVSPVTMKLIMYEGDKKYAARGTTRVKLKEYMGGDYTLDDAFKTAPAAYKTNVDKLWKQYR
jgi:hypothetical protein